MRKLVSGSLLISLYSSQVFDNVTFEVDSEIDREQVLWPRHCVQNSKGAELHPDLIVAPNAVIVKKGQDPDVDSYSAFWDNSKLRATELQATLSAAEVEEVFVCGIATDVCVKATTIDALEHGFRVSLIEDACRGVDEKAIRDSLNEIRGMGGKVILAKNLL